MTIWLHPSLPWENVHEVRVDHFPFVIGRQSDSDCSLPLAFISRHHCRFTQQGTQIMVQDMESHNGTFVNGQTASLPLPVQHGDEVAFGPVSFRVVILPSPFETTENCREVTPEQPDPPGNVH